MHLCYNLGPVLDRITVFGPYANSAFPAQKPQKGVSDPGLHVCSQEFLCQKLIKVKSVTKHPKTRNRLVQMIMTNKSIGPKGLNTMMDLYSYITCFYLAYA